MFATAYVLHARRQARVSDVSYRRPFRWCAATYTHVLMWSDMFITTSAVQLCDRWSRCKRKVSASATQICDKTRLVLTNDKAITSWDSWRLSYLGVVDKWSSVAIRPGCPNCGGAWSVERDLSNVLADCVWWEAPEKHHSGKKTSNGDISLTQLSETIRERAGGLLGRDWASGDLVVAPGDRGRICGLWGVWSATGVGHAVC